MGLLGRKQLAAVAEGTRETQKDLQEKARGGAWDDEME